MGGLFIFIYIYMGGLFPFLNPFPLFLTSNTLPLNS